MHAFSFTFTGAHIPYRCLVINESANDPFIPDNSHSDYFWDNKTQNVIQACKRLVDVNVQDWNSKNYTEEEDCKDGYNWFTTGDLSYTAIKRWEIVCSKFWLKAFIQSVYYMSQFFGSISIGLIADKFGRKKAFFIAISIQVLCGTAMAAAPYWPIFSILRMGVGFAHPGIFLLGVIISVELVGPRFRIITGGIVNAFFSSGQLMLGLLAYFIRDYQHLQLAISLPALIFIVYIFFVNESPRWLISQGRFVEADEILQKAAKCNKSSLPDHWHRHIETKIAGGKKQFVPGQQQSYSYRDLLRTRNIRKRTLICSLVCWPAATMAYYGLAMNPNMLGGDLYLPFLIGGCLDIRITPVLLIVNMTGRKSLVVFGFLLTAAFLFTIPAVSDDYIMFKTMLILISKTCLTSTISILYVYTPELFPTIIRSMAVGVCSMVARIGVVGSCFISFYLVESSKVVVIIIYGCLCLFAGIMTLFLPETTGQMQVESIEEAESFGSDQPIFIFGWQMARKSPAKVSKQIPTDKLQKEMWSDKVSQRIPTEKAITLNPTEVKKESLSTELKHIS